MSINLGKIWTAITSFGLNIAKIVLAIPGQFGGFLKSFVVGIYTKISQFRWKRHFLLFLNITAWIVSIFSIYFSYRNNEGLQNQLKIQQKAYEANLTIQFIIEHSSEETKDTNGNPKRIEKLSLKNISGINAGKVEADWKPYFVFDNGLVFSRRRLEEELSEKPELLQKVSHLVKSPEYISALFEDERSKTITDIKAGGITDDTLSEVSIRQFLSLAEAIGAKAIIRWKITFVHGISQQKDSQDEYIWIHNYNKNQPVANKNKTRENLKDVIGGKKIMQIIQKYEDESNEVMFDFDDKLLDKKNKN